MEINIEKYLYDKGSDYFSSFIIAKEHTSVGLIREKLAKILKLDADSILLKIWNLCDSKDFKKSIQDETKIHIYQIYINEELLNIDELVKDYNLEDTIPFYTTSKAINEMKVDTDSTKGMIDIKEDEFFELCNREDGKIKNIMSKFKKLQGLND